MKFGLIFFPTDQSMSPADFARAAEEHGFESIFFPEHTHIPTSRRTPFPAGGELRPEYKRLLDPFLALLHAAAVTRELRIGTGVCLVTEHDPIALAKTVATLDLLSGGRFIFGVGAGWNREEMENHGTRPSQRWQVLRERILAMKAIWTEEEAEFHGRFVDFDPIWSWPKPVQKPHPPVYVGASGPLGLRHVVEYGDGWFPIGHRDPHTLDAPLQELRRLMEETGRERPIPITVCGVPKRPDAVEYYRELGVERCIFWMPSAPADRVLPELERTAEFVRQLA